MNTMDIKKDTFKEKLLKRCDELDFAMLAKDVESFLMQPQQSQRVTDFNTFIRKQLAANTSGIDKRGEVL